MTKPTTVAPGVTLILRAGTRLQVTDEGRLLVEGTLHALGSPGKPVRLEGSRSSTQSLIEANSPTASVRLHGTELTGASSGVTVRRGFLGITRSSFSDNGTAITLDLKGRGEFQDLTVTKNEIGLSVHNSATARVRNLTAAQNRVGVEVSNFADLELSDSTLRANVGGYVQHNQCGSRIERCTFEENQAGVDLRQTRASPSISFSTFRANKIGISASLFAHPFVDACEFRANEVAFSAIQICRPFVRYGLFEANGQAIRLDKKTNARIERNALQRNEVALFADFSSYPEVAGNQFLGNVWHVRLGIYESLDFEKRQGSKGIMMGVAKQSETKNPYLLEGDVPSGEGVLSVAGNAWDDETLGEMAAGPDADLSRFWDGKDQPQVRYEGFEGEYAVDQIEFLPPLSGPPPAVGPGAWLPFRSGPETGADAPDSSRLPPGAGPKGKAP